MRLPEIQAPRLKKIHDFAQWAISKLSIQGNPKISYSTDKTVVDKNRSFGSTNPTGNIWVYIGDRNTADCMRTLVHELVHYRQFEKGITMPETDEDRYKIEDQANAIAGRLMRAYGLKHQEIYEWKFKKSKLSESEFSQAYQKRWTREKGLNSELSFRPAHLLAGYLTQVDRNALWEHKDIDELKKFQKMLKRYDQIREVSMNPGNDVSIIQFEPHINASTIQVRGFVHPKTIKDVFYDQVGDVDWIEFVDGSTFPDREFLSHNKGGGDWEGLSTLFFPGYSSAKLALDYIAFNAMKMGKWTLSTVNLTESHTINEGRTGSIQPDVATALPATYSITCLKNQDPYLQYRFSVAIAGAKGRKSREKDGIAPFHRSTMWGENELVVSFDPHIKDWIDDALTQMNFPISDVKQMTTSKSQEMPDVFSKSPIQAFKGYGKKEK